MVGIPILRLEHYRSSNTLGVDDTTPRLSWEIPETLDAKAFVQSGYEVELSKHSLMGKHQATSEILTRVSTQCTLVPWPFKQPLHSRQAICVRIRLFDKEKRFSEWSSPARLETGLLAREDWASQRISAPWSSADSGPVPEHLYRKCFDVRGQIQQARLYITTQGVYEAEINGEIVGDYFMAPGWTSYEGRLQYQTYDVTAALHQGLNCLGVRVAEGWFCGRLGFEGGHRNIWGPHVALLAQLEISYEDERFERISTDGSWKVAEGPIRLAEIYDGEKYDATQEIPLWSSPFADIGGAWQSAKVMAALQASTGLVAGFGEPVRRVETLQPKELITTPSGKRIVDFGQNLVGYVKLSGMVGQRNHKVTLSHAEVLEDGELGTRPLRICQAVDEYVMKGDETGEQYEPRFTFHGFRYVQMDNWPTAALRLDCVEAVVCHTDMASSGHFSCSDDLVNQLYRNICWGMRGNFLSVPTDCPQRDERLGWTGDLAVFAPTATLIYNCFGILKTWLIDLEYDQGVLGGVPPMVSPNSTLPDPVWCRRVPCAIWHDATILVPWELYQETGDIDILAQQYKSMTTWLDVLPRGKETSKHLWDNSIFQLGDWLDPVAPPDRPWESVSDARMIANMFLIHSLDIMIGISEILGQDADNREFAQEAKAARREFHEEYVTPNGRLVSDSQAAYALAICFDILDQKQKKHAAQRLVYLVRKKGFKIATGFAGTPYICEALAITGNLQVAYAMLLEKSCPSWLYPVTMGATTVWERWDSMLPDGSINPGEMTSFNHYAFGAIAKFMFNRVAGLQRLDLAWRSCRVAPGIGAQFSKAAASHETPRGLVSCSWECLLQDDGSESMALELIAPCDTEVEVILPTIKGEEKRKLVGPGRWSLSSVFRRDYEWPVLPLPPKS